jgi:hypothetical protein
MQYSLLRNNLLGRLFHARRHPLLLPTRTLSNCTIGSVRVAPGFVFDGGFVLKEDTCQLLWYPRLGKFGTYLTLISRPFASFLLQYIHPHDRELYALVARYHNGCGYSRHVLKAHHFHSF